MATQIKIAIFDYTQSRGNTKTEAITLNPSILVTVSVLSHVLLHIISPWRNKYSFLCFVAGLRNQLLVLSNVMK